MMRQPTLFLTVGLPYTGKTTAARRIEIEHKAFSLTKDEWVKALYGDENPPSAQDVIEGRLIQIGLRTELSFGGIIGCLAGIHDSERALTRVHIVRGLEPLRNLVLQDRAIGAARLNADNEDRLEY